MRKRSLIIFILFLFFIIPVSAQEFTTLGWKKAISAGTEEKLDNIPAFVDAVYYNEGKLPYYVKNIDLGLNYSAFEYDVKVEYPEYEVLSKNAADALIASGEKLEKSPVVSTSLGISAKRGILEVRFVPLVLNGGKYMRINSFKLSLNKRAVSRISKLSENKGERYVENSVLASGKWVKIKVSDTGVFQMTNSELVKMGFSNPSKVRLYGYGGNVLPEDLRISKVDDLQEVPLWRESGYVLFYANGPITWKKAKKALEHTQNYYSTYGCYFLTESDQEPIAFPQETSLSEDGASTLSTFLDYALYERETFSWVPFGRMFFEDYDYKTQNTKSYTLSTPDIVDGDASVTVSFSAYSPTITTVDVNVNGTNCGSLTVGATTSEYVSAAVAQKTFAWAGSKSANTIVKLTHNRASTVSGRLDYIRLNYTRALALSGSFLTFRGDTVGKRKFVVNGANENTRIWDVTDANNFRQLTGSLSGGKYTVVVNNTNESKYVAVNLKGSFGKVEVLGDVPNQNLHALKGIDMIIITPPNTGFIKEAERLAEAHREKDGLTVQIVTSDQVYNEFSSGTPDATAYRWLMKMLYDRATTEKEQPKYLLLLGDGAWDNRMQTSAWKLYKPSDFLLCYESDNSVSHTDSYVLEEYFGLLDDGEGMSHTSDKVDIGVGRFPVRTVDQAKEMVDKTLNYIYNKEAGVWKNVACILGDDGDGNGHMGNADAVAKVVESNYPDLLVKKIYWDAYKRETSASGNSYPDAKKDVLEQLKTGALIVAYLGHGNPEGLSHEWVLRIADMKALTSPRLPLWLTMGCDIGPFDSAEESFGKETFLNPKGGAIAVLTSTRTTYPSPNEALAKNFIKEVLNKNATTGECLRLGDALRIAKCETSSSVNKLQYVLLGDPALRLASAEQQIVVDEFNSVGSDKAATTIKAGGKVTVKGRVLNEEGATAEDFRGTVHFTLKDRIEKVITRKNDPSLTVPFQYYDRPVSLAVGSDSIRAGVFSFTFPVPMDISYSNESGLLNLYAVNASKEKEGKGYFTKFLIGGTEDGAMNSDSIGPNISMYLNTPDFPYGGEVNETPVLVAELEDEDGINTVGNGIGHDLVAVIDDSSTSSYVLNSYYTPAFGDYTRGTVRYSLPELSEGKHKIMLRAWDVKNNSSTSELEFTVKHGLRPELLSIDCISPVRDKTTFILSHDRPETELEVGVTVYDFSGREMWVHMETGTSSNSTYYIDWDLTSNGGQRLQPGIYLFRASIASGNSKESSQARKIVILAQ